MDENKYEFEKLIDRANKAFEFGDYDIARRYYSRAIRIRPTSTRALTGRGDTWVKENEYDKAFADYNEAFRRDPENQELARKLNLIKSLQSSEEGRQELEKRLGMERKRTAMRLERELRERLEMQRQELEKRLEIERRTTAERLEMERKATTERLEKEYNEKLKEELNTAVKQITADSDEFRKEADSNMEQSVSFRRWAVGWVVAIPFWILLVSLVLHQILAIKETTSVLTSLFWLFITATSSSPFLLLAWLFLRWRYEAKTLAYGFHYKAIVEARINAYFHDDPKQFKKMLESYIVNWVEKSPLEVMLTIGEKKKNTSVGETDFPAEVLLDKITELIKSINPSKGP